MVPDRGVCDKGIELAETLDRLRHGFAIVRQAGRVALDDDHVAAEFTAEVCRLCGRSLEHAHRRVFFEKALHQRAAEAGAASRDHGHLSVDPAHLSLASLAEAQG